LASSPQDSFFGRRALLYFGFFNYLQKQKIKTQQLDMLSDRGLQSDDADAVIERIMCEAATYKEQIKSIDAKLGEMGGYPTYGSLPHGCMGQEEFTERYNQISGTISNSESELRKIKQSRDILEERLGRLGHQEDKMLLQSNQHMDAQEKYWRTQLNGQKNALLDFMTNNRPMDAEPYLAKKHKLLDAKLSILIKKRQKL
jgi:hypothetical protein